MPEIKLMARESEILKALPFSGGLTSGSVAILVYGKRGHKESAWVRFWLLRMKSNGLVDYLDDKKPVCWIITEKGLDMREALTGEAHG